MRQHPRTWMCIRNIVRDLITDIRYSGKKIAKGMNVEEETRYRDLCLQELRDLFRHRHTVKLDRYGWPDLDSFQYPRSNPGSRC